MIISNFLIIAKLSGAKKEYQSWPANSRTLHKNTSDTYYIWADTIFLFSRLFLHKILFNFDF